MVLDRKALNKARAALRKQANDESASRFFSLCYRAGILTPVRELRFAEGRKWAFDFAWPPDKIAVEVEGGVFSGGRHTRGKGFLNDCEKYNEAALLGWTLLRVTPSTLCTDATITMLRRAFRLSGTVTSSVVRR